MARREQNLPTVPSGPLIDRAFQIALQYGGTAYDSLDVVLAVASNSDFVTADERLANALGGDLPVKWL
jgi:predicted nucleic acid-binding protein